MCGLTQQAEAQVHLRQEAFRNQNTQNGSNQLQIAASDFVYKYAGIARNMGHSRGAWRADYDVYKLKRQRAEGAQAYAAVVDLYASPAAQLAPLLQQARRSLVSEDDEQSEASEGEEDEDGMEMGAEANAAQEEEEEDRGWGVSVQAAAFNAGSPSATRQLRSASQLQSRSEPRALGRRRVCHADGSPVARPFEPEEGPAARGGNDRGLALARVDDMRPAVWARPAHYSRRSGAGSEVQALVPQSAQQQNAEEQLASVLANGGTLPRGGWRVGAVARAEPRPNGAPPLRTVLKAGGRFLTVAEAMRITTVPFLQRWIDANLVAPTDPLTGLSVPCRTKNLGSLRATASGGATRGLGGE